MRPEQTAGPYYVDTQLERSDIRSDPANGAVSEGTPLELTFQVSRVMDGACSALEGAIVDVWQCDALGVYSDVLDIDGLFDARGKQFLRGHQVTDDYGVARFTTVYPGWYPGRAVHIHFRIRTGADADEGYEFTSQLYFDDSFTDEVFKEGPYASRPARNTRNEDDQIFGDGGDELMLSVTRGETGFAGRFEIGLQLA